MFDGTERVLCTEKKQDDQQGSVDKLMASNKQGYSTKQTR